MPTHESPTQESSKQEPVLILDGALAVNTWTHLGDEQPVPVSGDISVSLERFRKEGALLVERGQGRLGVRVTPATLAEELAPFVAKLALVVFELKTFMDGRYFTTARLLRERYGYRGEIRVIGAVTPDQMFFMKRCGITSFELAAGHRSEVALAALSSFSQVYQAAIDQPHPIYARD